MKQWIGCIKKSKGYPPLWPRWARRGGIATMEERRQAILALKRIAPMKISASLLSRVAVVAGAVTLATGAGLIGLSGLSSVQAQPAVAPPTDEYTAIAKPIFTGHCMPCHSEARSRGGLSLETPAGILKGGKMDGPVIVPGHPEQSLLVKLIRHEGPADDPMPMPPPSHDKLSDADIAAVTKWIQDGAVMPQ
jgi:cytochrome c